jgi:hypothetical protein
MSIAIDPDVIAITFLLAGILIAGYGIKCDRNDHMAVGLVLIIIAGVMV